MVCLRRRDGRAQPLRARSWWLLLALLPGAGGAQPASAGAAAAIRPTVRIAERLLSDGGTFEISLTTRPDPIALNEYFDLEVEVRNIAAAGDDSFWVSIDALMPAHAHGMNTQPVRVEIDAGRFSFSGMLLHMAGIWEIRFEIAQGRIRETAAVVVEIARDAGVAFSDDERAVIFSLSPLPEVPPDTTNRLRDSRGAIELGRTLFFDRRLSGDGARSCAECHDPGQHWTDGRTLAQGAAAGRRNTPSLWNVAHHRWFFWDGRADSLWSQALKPIEDASEMNSSRLSVVRLIAEDPQLRTLYEKAAGPLAAGLSDRGRFPESGGPLSLDADGQLNWWAMTVADRDAVNGIFANAGKALAAFVSTIVSPPSRFDRFVGELREGKQTSLAISDSAQRGLRIFIGKGNCVLCHSGPLLSNKEFHDIRVPALDAELPADLGRYEGIERLYDDEFIAAGPYSDDQESARAMQLAYLRDGVGVLGHFRTPGLRNVAATPPYMHQGQFATLREVVLHYSTLESAAAPADPLHVEYLLEEPLQLSDQEIDAVVAFLESLSSH